MEDSINYLPNNLQKNIIDNQSIDTDSIMSEPISEFSDDTQSIMSEPISEVSDDIEYSGKRSRKKSSKIFYIIGGLLLLGILVYFLFFSKSFHKDVFTEFKLNDKFKYEKLVNHNKITKKLYESIPNGGKLKNSISHIEIKNDKSIIKFIIYYKKSTNKIEISSFTEKIKNYLNMNSLCIELQFLSDIQSRSANGDINTIRKNININDVNFY